MLSGARGLHQAKGEISSKLKLLSVILKAPISRWGRAHSFRDPDLSIRLGVVLGPLLTCSRSCLGNGNAANGAGEFVGLTRFAHYGILTCVPVRVRRMPAAPARNARCTECRSALLDMTRALGSPLGKLRPPDARRHAGEGSSARSHAGSVADRCAPARYRAPLANTRPVPTIDQGCVRAEDSLGGRPPRRPPGMSHLTDHAGGAVESTGASPTLNEL
jgi:hypothetical protein